MRGGGGAGGDGRHGTEGFPLPYKNCLEPGGAFGDTFWVFFLLLPLFFFFFFSSPPVLFVEPNQKCQSVRVSQKGSDYKITETDVGPAHTHPHTEAEARAGPRGRRAGIKQPPPTPAGPPLPPPSRLCPDPSRPPAPRDARRPRRGPAPLAAAAGERRGDEPAAPALAHGQRGGSAAAAAGTYPLGREVLCSPALLRATFLASASAPAPLPAPFPLP